LKFGFDTFDFRGLAGCRRDADSDGLFNLFPLQLRIERLCLRVSLAAATNKALEAFCEWLVLLGEKMVEAPRSPCIGSHRTIALLVVEHFSFLKGNLTDDASETATWDGFKPA